MKESYLESINHRLQRQTVASKHICLCNNFSCECTNNLVMFLIFLFIQLLVYKHLLIMLSLHLANIVYRPCRVHFVQKKVSLHLSSTDFRVGG